MSDIDFDELDKAVSNLMKETTGAADEAPVANAPETTTPVQPEVPAPSAQGETPADVPVAAPAPVAAAATPITRRRGQFMDIVAPQSSKRPAAPVRRQAVTIQPTSPDITPQEPVAVEEAPVQSSFETGAFDGEPKESTSAAAMPDLVDSKSVSAEPITEQLVEEPESVTDVQPEPPVEAPLVSPFLPDAKVEKRPLGSPTPLTLDTLGSELKKAKQEDVNESTAPTAESSPAQPIDMPAELHPELTNIEAESTSSTSSADSPTHDEVTDSQAANVEHMSEKVPSSAPAQSTGAPSIAQQYEEQQSTGETASGSIYDTEHYHQPLQHPEKKKSSLLAIVLILACILLGAAGAALYYYFNMMR